MPARNDHHAWDDDEAQRCADLAALGTSAERTAAILNREFHRNKPRRTTAAVANHRRKHRIHVAQLPRNAPPLVAGVELEQRVERTETADGISLVAIGQRIRTVAELIAHADIDLARYEISEQKANTWDTTIKNAAGKPERVQNFQVKVTVRPKAGPNVLEAVEAVIRGAFKGRKRLAAPPARAAKADHDILQALVIADPHIGKYAWGRETGHGDYDIAIATRLLRESASALLAAGDPSVGRRAIWLLGDFFHYDNPAGQTTGGTALDRDGRIEKMMEEGAAALFDIIEASAARGPTDVVLVPGNHDAVLTVALRQILAAHFRGDRRVTIDSRGTSRKYIRHGRCLIGLTHGDKAKKRLGELMAAEASVAWGQTSYREIHTGHLHSIAEVQTVAGVIIRTAPALCPPDGWHASEGFVGSVRGMESYTYHARGGLVGMRVSNPDMKAA